MERKRVRERKKKKERHEKKNIERGLDRMSSM